MSSPHTYFQNLVCIIFQESKLIKSISLSPNLGRLQFSHLAVSDSLQPHGLQYARLPCPPLTPGACSHSCPSSRWCPPTVSSSVVPFSSFNLSQHQGLFQWVGSLHQVATHSSILAWIIPWTKQAGRLQSMGLQRIRHDWATHTSNIIRGPPKHPVPPPPDEWVKPTFVHTRHYSVAPFSAHFTDEEVEAQLRMNSQ